MLPGFHAVSGRWSTRLRELPKLDTQHYLKRKILHLYLDAPHQAKTIWGYRLGLTERQLVERLILSTLDYTQ